MKTWPIFGIFVIQVLLLLAHWFLFHTWIAFWEPPAASVVLALRLALLILAFSFVVAALLSFKYSNPLVTAIYELAATWLGFLNFLFFAACITWLAWYLWALAKLSADSAAARPRPEVAPVTIATLPSRRSDCSGVQSKRRRRAW